MYTKLVEFNDFFGKKRKQEVHFNLTSHEVFKLLPEFQALFAWTEKVGIQDPDSATETSEVIEFYNYVEEILLAAWGVPDADGLHFRKGGVYDFKESAQFHELMAQFVANPGEANRLVDGLMPKDLQEIVKTADANLAELAKSGEAPDALQARIDALLAEKAEREANPVITPVVAGGTVAG